MCFLLYKSPKNHYYDFDIIGPFCSVCFHLLLYTTNSVPSGKKCLFKDWLIDGSSQRHEYFRGCSVMLDRNCVYRELPYTKEIFFQNLPKEGIVWSKKNNCRVIGQVTAACCCNRQCFCLLLICENCLFIQKKATI